MAVYLFTDLLIHPYVGCVAVYVFTDPSIHLPPLSLCSHRTQSSEGEALAQDMACAFYETSASDGGSDITELFHELHREIKRRKMVETKGRRRSSAQQVRSVFNRVLNKIGNTS